MNTISNDKRQINVKVNRDYYEAAKLVFKDKGLDVTTAFNQFIREVAIKQALPFKTEKEQKIDRLIEEMTTKIDMALDRIDSGEGISLDEARRKLIG